MTATLSARTLATPRTALLLAAGLSVAALAAPSPADARGFVAFSFGVPLGPAYYPPPVYYAPPPVYYAPPPVVYAPPAAAPSYQSPSQGQDCRAYQSPTTIDGRPQSTTGTVCLQPDGTWQIVR
jgi:hypothetical protein